MASEGLVKGDLGRTRGENLVEEVGKGGFAVRSLEGKRSLEGRTQEFKSSQEKSRKHDFGAAAEREPA